MKKKLFVLPIIIVVMIAMLVFPASAATEVDSGTCGDNLTWTLDDEGVLTISGEGEMTGGLWLYHRDSIQRVVIEPGVTSISEYAFDGCSNLTEVVIPEGLTTIGGRAFFDCVNLVDITIPDSATNLGEWIFRGCSSLKSMIIPEGVTQIGNGMFFGCKSLTSVTIPEDVTSIGASAFCQCNNLASVTIPENVTSIGDYAFASCGSFTEVEIPAKVTSIGQYAFNGCYDLASVTFYGDAPAIDAVAFSWVTTTVYYPCSNDTWTDEVLQNYDGTLTWKMYHDLEVIAEGVEPTCEPGLTDKTRCTRCGTVFEQKVIPGRHNFEGDCCTECGIIGGFCGDNLTWTLVDGTLTISGEGGMHYYNEYSGQLAPWNYNYRNSIRKVVVEPGVTAFGREAFYGCSNLTEVIIPDSVTDLGEWTFQNCSSLKYVTLPENISRIGHGLFYGCSSLSAVTIPENVTSIGGSAFCWCSSLSSVTIPKNVTSINSRFVFSSCSSLTAIEVAEENEYYTSVDGVLFTDDGTLLMCYPMGKPGAEYEIPAGVTTIGYEAFYNCGNLTSVVIPEGVTYIDQRAFTNCGNLDAVTFLGDAPEIHAEAFSWTRATMNYFCNNDTWTDEVLQNYNGTLTWKMHHDLEVIAEGVEPTCEPGLTDKTRCTRCGTVFEQRVISAKHSFVGNNCEFCGIFGGACGDNLSWTLSDGVLSVGGEGNMEIAKSAPWESYRDSITHVVIEPGVTSIASYAFNYCPNLTSVEIADTVISIEDYAFQSCNGLTSVTIPAGVTQIGTAPFHACLNLEAYKVDPANARFCAVDGVLFSADGARLISYPNGKVGSTYRVPAGVTKIGGYAFYGCSSLTAIELPEELQEIMFSAFSDCSALRTITIPANVTSVASDAFSYCHSLTAIEVAEGNDWYISVDDVLYTADRAIIVRYPAAKTGTYYEIPDGVSYIASSAFEGCSQLATVIIPQSVEGIGYIAFANSGLTSVVIPDGVTNLENSVFENCSALTSVIIPDSVTYISGWAFSNCSSLKAVTIPDSVGSLENYVFYNCTALTSVTIPDSVTYIGNRAFYNCSSLASVDLPEGLTRIGTYAFSGCSSLTYVMIPDSVASVPRYAFSNCSNLISIAINGATTIEDWAFQNCYNLSKISFRGEAPMIGNFAFPGVTATCTYRCDKGSWTEDKLQNYGGNLTWKKSHKFEDGVCLYCSFSNLFASGVCGEELTWTLTTEGLLTISGTGAMTEYDSPSDCPWEDYRGMVTTVVIENGVTTIDNDAIFAMPSLTSVSVPASVTQFSLWSCSSLLEVKVDEENEYYSDIDGILFDKNQTTLLCYPASKAETVYTVPDSVTTIGNDAFMENANLVSVKIHAGVTSIGFRPFYWNRNLETITVQEGNPNYVSENGVLYDKEKTVLICCPAKNTLIDLVVPGTVVEIHDAAFCNNSNIRFVYLPKSLKYLGSQAFCDCNSLKKVVFLGSAPEFAHWDTFSSHVGTVFYYPCDDESWTKEAMDRFGEGLTWVKNHKFVTEGYCEACRILGGVCGDNLTWTLDDGVFTISGSGRMYDYDGMNPAPWYELERENIREVVVMPGVTSIGSQAFADCSNLTTVTLPEGLTEISWLAFLDCTSLTDVVLPNSLDYIGGRAFESCVSLTSVTIPASVNWMGEGAFSLCTNLSEIKVDPENTAFVTVDGVLYDAQVTTVLCYPAGKTGTRYEIPNGVNRIGHYAFSGTGLTTIIVPESVTRLDGWAFMNCTNLTDVTIPKDLTRLEWGVFSGCSSLTTVEIPETVTEICGSAFSNCSSLTTVKIPNGVTVIGNNAFYNCSSLTAIEIPAGVTTIGEWAFSGCSSLTALKIPEGVTSIGFGTFQNCSSLTTVDLPAGLTNIGEWAFSGCSSLTTAKIPEGVTSIGFGTFQNCSSLTTVDLPAGLTIIGNWAFSDCSSLTTVELPVGLTTIGDRAFSVCSSLTAVKLPAGLTYLGEGAFNGCSALTSVVIPGSVAEIKNFTFCQCVNLADVEISEGVTHIGISAFLDNALTSVVIPASVTYIDNGAFAWNDELTSITFMGGAPGIYENAFAGVTAVVYYPADNTSWTEEVMQNYGGSLTWNPSGVPAPEVTVELNSSGKPKLSWNKVDGASKYYLYIYEEVDGKPVYLKRVTSTYTYINHTSAETGKTYYYEVTAVVKGEEGPVSNRVSIKVPGGIAAPEVTVELNSSGKPKLSWAKVTGATTYTIYIYEEVDGNVVWVKNATTSNLYLNHNSAEAGKTYYYEVAAFVNGNKGPVSNRVSIKVPGGIAAPEVTVELNSSGKPKLSWNKVDGASKYYLYIYEEVDGKPVYLKRVTSTYTYINHTSAEAGKTYYYEVTAVVKGEEGPVSNRVSIKVPG